LTITMLADAGDESAAIVSFWAKRVTMWQLPWKTSTCTCTALTTCSPKDIACRWYEPTLSMQSRNCTDHVLSHLKRTKHNAELWWQSTSSRDDRSLSIKNDGLCSLGLAKHICQVPVVRDPQCLRRLQPQCQSHKPIVACQRVSATYISCLPTGLSTTIGSM